jgi:hypothetical protein
MTVVIMVNCSAEAGTMSLVVPTNAATLVMLRLFHFCSDSARVTIKIQKLVK